ncbi:FAD synthetase family protein [Bacillus methanolicus]|nr:FAD synthetase family protein [Bacillus methanolicus]
MRIHTERTLQLPASVLTIGALDGVHLGHQTLISRAKERAKELEVPLVVYTFDPPPRVYFKNTLLLTPLTEKIKRLRFLGVDHVIVASFDADYVTRGASSFLDELTDLNPLEIWAGPDFQFGRNKEGNINTLRERFTVHVLDPIRCDLGEIISSSRIRTLMMQDMLYQAERLLGWQTLFHDSKEDKYITNK